MACDASINQCYRSRAWRFYQVAGIWRCTSAAGAARAMDSRAGFIDGESHTYLSCSRTLGDPELKVVLAFEQMLSTCL